MNNSVVVNGGLQEENSLADDVKNLLSNALSLLDSGIDEDFKIWLNLKR